MLKKRIIPVLLLKDGRMVKGKEFKNYIDTGNPATAVKIYTSQYADELMFVDIQASLESRKMLIEIVSNAAKNALMPFTVGGGIKTIDHIREILAAGADKVLITTAAYENHDFILEAVKNFGSQAIVGGIDYKFDENLGKNHVWTHCNTKKTSTTPLSFAIKLEELGVGEIMLNCINKDGMMKGYDKKTTNEISSKLNLPVITCGGAGNFQHVVSLFKETNAAAAACSSLFHFGDNCPMQARTYLRNHGVEMRAIK
ncbi:MAG: imidazole glycerol phosphate synthase subunit HisF [Pelagibacterales bacterium]|nr:imidazole glycerol phosphate synthase subunit HisF [Pelagibacterales bacterium]